MTRNQPSLLLLLALGVVGITACDDLRGVHVDGTKSTTTDGAANDSGPRANGLPPGVVDDPSHPTNKNNPTGDPAKENSDQDGFCLGSEGYFPCDDGAPPGSGVADPIPPPGGGNGGTGEPGNGGGDDGSGDNGGGGNGGGGNGGGDNGSGGNGGGGNGGTGEPGGSGGDDGSDGSGGGGGDNGGGGSGGGDNGGSGGGGTPQCSTQTFTPTTLPPRILLVVDRSGSMGQGATGFGGSKWDSARSALQNVVTSLDDQVNFGLMLFPAVQDNTVCSAGVVEQDVATRNARAIITELNNTGPGGATPTASTLRAARGVMNRLGAQGGARAVILTTDGGPNCNDSLDRDTCRCTNPDPTFCQRDVLSCLDDVETVRATRALNDAGFPVFVIGIPGAENFSGVLNRMATAGGTATSGTTKFYDASSTNALATALEDVAQRVASCRFDLRQAPNDPARITVKIGTQAVNRDTQRANGWDLVDANTIELFGAACTQVSSQTQVNIGFCFVR